MNNTHDIATAPTSSVFHETSPGVERPQQLMMPIMDFFDITNKGADAINELAAGIGQWAEKKGFNEFPLYAGDDQLSRLYRGNKCMLIVTEVAELQEGIRAKVMPQDDHVPELTTEEAELADIMIRCLQYAHEMGINIGRAVQLKHAYNITRPYKHGKSC